ncbi:MAG: hypothetical protein U1F57_03400 [bacterium]
MFIKVLTCHEILVGPYFRAYADQTFDVFLEMVCRLSGSTRFPIDYEQVAQLQDLYFLLREGILKIREEGGGDGSSCLFLSVRDPARLKALETAKKGLEEVSHYEGS